jgi:hypothetical protein
MPVISNFASSFFKVAVLLVEQLGEGLHAVWQDFPNMGFCLKSPHISVGA